MFDIIDDKFYVWNMNSTIDKNNFLADNLGCRSIWRKFRIVSKGCTIVSEVFCTARVNHPVSRVRC